MPQLGEIRKAREIGKGCNPGVNHVWAACVDCGKERWIRIIGGVPRGERCQSCSSKRYGLNHIGDKGCNWKGGRYQSTSGYVYLWISKDDFFYPMLTKTGKILEHRLVMAKHLGRCLNRWEHVHHKNGIRNDNRIENLELTIGSQHSILHGKGYSDGYTKGLKDGRIKQIKELKARITELESKYEYIR